MSGETEPRGTEGLAQDPVGISGIAEFRAQGS